MVMNRLSGRIAVITGAAQFIGAAAAFLASAEAKFILGQVIAIDGGLSAPRIVPNEAEFQFYLIQ